MNVNFGLFPPFTEKVAYDKDGRKYGRGPAKSLARKTRDERARAGRSGALDGACRRRPPRE